MEPPFTLRPATHSDFDLICTQRREALRESSELVFEPWNDLNDREHFRARFDPRQIRIVEIDGKGVGHLELMEEPAILRIRTIALLPAFCGHGIGTAVVRELLSSSPNVSLRVLKVNERALRFYVKLGFQTVGESDEHWWKMERVAESTN